MLLLRKGAEADLFMGSWHGLKVMMKKRSFKRYREANLDYKLRHYRTIHESLLIHEAKMAGVPTPLIYQIDVLNTTIIMEYIEGERIKEVIEYSKQKTQENLCTRIGSLIGKLHKCGIIHGDLTTSNMIINNGKKIYFIDFGLGEFSKELEEQAMDILLVRRSLESTHYKYSKECFKKIIKGYSDEMGEIQSKKVVKRMKEISRRGRYNQERHD
jgi:TP53 regulating kinase-like protein